MIKPRGKTDVRRFATTYDYGGAKVAMSINLNPAGTRAESWLDRILLAAVASSLLLATSSMAQQGNRDYYRANETRDDAQTLRTAEQYHMEPGIVRMNSRDYPGAYGDFAFILGFFPNHPRALAMISELCDLKWKSPRCEVDEWFQKAIDRNPKAAQTYLVLGLHLHRLNRLQEAVGSYQKALSLNPSSANAHYNLGLAYYDLKQFELSNQQAQLSYALGVRLPGLRDKLTKAGQWKPLDPEELKRQLGTNAPESTATNPQ
jgi:tetratricopeptide (TPR) repeat protein